jgi:hypothetical protein
MFNIDTTTSPGDLMISDTSFSSGQNLIKNPLFETIDNWSYQSSDNITSQWFAPGE